MNRGRGAAPRVRKATGETQAFSSRKLYRSLRAAGAGKARAARVLRAIERAAGEETTTGDLERLAVRALTEESRPLAARYLLKKALFALGPSGYPFERLVAEIFSAQGYHTEVGVTLPGKCVRHEVDVVANRGGSREYIECKFRTGPGSRCDVKVALYVHARAMDLRAAPGGLRFSRYHLVTNGKFTGDAVRYGECVGLGLLGWDHPRGRSLARLIEEHRLHPLTCLTALTGAQKAELIDRGALLCRDLRTGDLLEALGLAPAVRDEVDREVLGVISPPTR